MKNGESLFQGYEFSFEGGENNSYLFQIVAGIIYEIKFKCSQYLFKSEVLSYFIYEFSLAVLHKPVNYINLPDKLIAPTVVNIFLDFYQRFHDDNITIYICDSSDFRQHVRKRKFDQWFNEFNAGAFIKTG